MDFNQFVSLLEKHAGAIYALTQGISGDDARWKPDAESWSILEVINHLYDEEREDFRVRVDILLHRPTEPFPPIEPGTWVTARGYNTRDLETSIDNFRAEREKSLEWLQTLASPNWEVAVKTPWRDELKAGDVFASWVAHDVLHLRQLTELRYALVKKNAEPYDVAYAGEW